MEYNLSQKRTTQVNTRTQEKSVPKFLRKVYYMLEDNQHSEYVSWSNDETALVVKKPTEFANKVLPCYFKHNNLASFVRQLNMYNFKKNKNYQYDHTYGHEMFQRGKIELLRNIQRKSAEVSQVVLPKIEVARDHEESKQDFGSLFQENLNYKRVQKSLITQFQFVERKAKDIKTEINTLYEDSHKQEAKQDFLKKVIKRLSNRFGSNSIQVAIEQTVEDMNTNPEVSRISNSPKNPVMETKPLNAPNAFSSYSRVSEPFEEVSKRAQLPSYNSGVKRNAVDIFSNQELLSNECSEFQNSLYTADERLNASSYNSTNQQSDDVSKSGTYQGWYTGFEKKMYNPAQFLDVNKTNYRRSVLDNSLDEFDMFSRSDF
jgi:hypothetical protein